jgi:hypothetical protein
MVEFPNNRNNKGMSRLFRIIVSESAHFIWKLRCERRITLEDNPEKMFSEAEIRNRWLTVINQRLTLDRFLTDRTRYGKKALRTQTVLNTWSDVLMDKKSLPRNWIGQSGVLVGMRPLRPPGRNR